MANFKYKARNARGEPVQGTIDAPSADAVANQLFNSGITPISIDEAEEKSSGQLNLQLFEGKVTLDDKVMFSRQMYALTKAGIPMIRALNGLADTAKNRRFARILKRMADHLESGRTLSDAMRQHPDIFSHLYVSIVQVGENSGSLDQAFLQIARHLELDKEMRDRVKSALRYPIIVIIAMALVIVMLNIWVIPKFAGVFSKFGAELPWATKALLGFSGFMVNYWPWLLAALVISVVGFLYWKRTEHGKYLWDKKKMEFPISGGIVLRATLGRFARSFAMATRSGVPIIQSLTVVSRAVDNAYVESRVLEMRNGIERGESLTRTAMATNMFTPLVMQMLAVGEETGQVEDMMQEVAEFYEQEVDYDVKKLSSYIEPIVTVFLGIIVLILALGVFLPMWDLVNAVRN